MKSIIHDDELCYLCTLAPGTEVHHCIKGTANRKKSEQYGLTVRLCPECHRGTKGVHGRDGHAKDQILKEVAQRRFEEVCGTREDFIREFGKSFL